MDGARAKARVADDVGDLGSHLRLYERHLRAANRADAPIYKYLLAARQLIAYLEACKVGWISLFPEQLRRAQSDAMGVEVQTRSGRTYEHVRVVELDPDDEWVDLHTPETHSDWTTTRVAIDDIESVAITGPSFVDRG